MALAIQREPIIAEQHWRQENPSGQVVLWTDTWNPGLISDPLALASNADRIDLTVKIELRTSDMKIRVTNRLVGNKVPI